MDGLYKKLGNKCWQRVGKNEPSFNGAIVTGFSLYVKSNGASSERLKIIFPCGIHLFLVPTLSTSVQI